MTAIFKRVVIGCIFCIMGFQGKAQYVSIPDANFITYLTKNFPACMQGQMLDTTCVRIIQARSVSVNELNISDLNGIQYFDNLYSLNCNQNQLTYLPALPVTLKYLDCANNKLTTLPLLPKEIYGISCSNNSLTTLPALPSSLHILYCFKNQLITLPSLPNTLQDINCSWNQITHLPSLPASLIRFDCWSNQLATLPSLPPNLNHLNCDTNSITRLPDLSASLERLRCNSNLLTELPLLTQGLKYLSCESNLLTQLPMLPPSLRLVNCQGNAITVLPYLPASLTVLSCSNNLLKSLPYLPANLSYLKCIENNIACLPVLPNSMETLVTDSICRPNRPSSLVTDLPRNSPLCTDLKFSFNRVCAGDSTSFNLANANCHAFIWGFDDPVTGAQNNSTDVHAKHVFSRPGTFQVKLTSYVSDPATVLIQTVIVDELKPFDLGKDRSFCKEDKVELKAASNFSSYVWQDGSLAQTYVVQNSGTYSVAATNACGTVTDHITMQEYEIEIPNLFTPNNDGLNDVFEIKGVHGDAGELHVFSSWGAEIFNDALYYNNWNAVEMPDALYYYSYQLKNCPVKKGWVEVKRGL